MEQEYGSKINKEQEKTDNETEFTQSYYDHNYLNKQEELKNAKYYDLLFENEAGKPFNVNYWLSGRCVGDYLNYCAFDVMSVRSGSESCRVSGNAVFESDGDWLLAGNMLRPLISLDLSAKGLDLLPNTESGDVRYILKVKR